MYIEIKKDKFKDSTRDTMQLVMIQAIRSLVETFNKNAGLGMTVESTHGQDFVIYQPQAIMSLEQLNERAKL